MSNIILCADDSKTMQTVAEITFRVSDYQYVGATSADEALDKARAQKPALILADAAMPRKDGYELCRAIKDDPALADVPVIVMCGNSSSYDPARGSEVGADGHLNKPWDTQSLLDKVAELLQGAAKGARPAAKPAAAQASRPAVVTQPPILPATAPPRTPTMIGMPHALEQVEAEKPRPGQPAPAAAAGRQPGVAAAVDNAQPLSAPLPPRLYAKTPGKPETAPAPAAAAPAPTPAAAAAPAARPAPAAATPAARPPVGAPIARVATAPPVGAAAPAAPAAGRAPARPTSVGVPGPAAAPAATPPVAAAPAPAAAKAAPAPAAARPAPVAAALAAKAAPAPAPAPRPESAADSATAIGRPPMIRGQAKRRSPAVEALLQGAVARGAAAVALEAGLDPAGPEMRALLALSVDVVERIVWEVVPELAELIIRENLQDLATAKR